MENYINAEQLTHYAKIELALVILETVTHPLHSYLPMLNACNIVLKDGWGWLIHRSPNPEKMYWNTNPLLIEIDSTVAIHKIYEEEYSVKAAFYCAISTHYLVVCYALEIEAIENSAVQYSVGNDINEVSAELLNDLIENALIVQPLPEYKVWISSIIQKLLLQHSIRENGRVGRFIERDFFE